MRKPRRNENRNGLAFLAAGLVLVLAWPSTGLGVEGQENRTAFKVGAGAIFHTSQSFDPGLFYQAGFFTFVTPRLGLEVQVAGNRVHMDEPPAALGAGKLATTQILISAQYRFSQGKRITPYAIFGLEFNFFHSWPENEAEKSASEVVDRFAPHFGAGLEWLLSGWLALSTDVRYSIIKTWVEVLPREGPINEVNPDEVNQINLNALTIALGLKFYFSSL